MYPLLLIPPLRDYLWGGTRLIEEFGYSAEGKTAAEAWVLSERENVACRVQNGKFAGETLDTVLSRWGATALGTRGKAFPKFPLLVKLIDAHDRLSVQVHPDDTYAATHENTDGKTELWYVLDAEPGAELIYGFRRPLTADEFRRCLEDGSLEAEVNRVPVHPGDVFFIEAGTLHAIGAGILIAEVQQNSETTYRVSDYGRLGADGKPRALHREQALAVTRPVPPTRPYGAVGTITETEGGTRRELAACPLFWARLLSLCGTTSVDNADTFEHWLVLDGTATLCYGGERLPLKKGDSVLIPATVKVTVSGTATVLCSGV